jgi:hypothetical protein
MEVLASTVFSAPVPRFLFFCMRIHATSMHFVAMATEASVNCIKSAWFHWRARARIPGPTQVLSLSLSLFLRVFFLAPKGLHDTCTCSYI